MYQIKFKIQVYQIFKHSLRYAHGPYPPHLNNICIIFQNIWTFPFRSMRTSNRHTDKISTFNSIDM